MSEASIAATTLDARAASNTEARVGSMPEVPQAATPTHATPVVGPPAMTPFPELIAVEEAPPVLETRTASARVTPRLVPTGVKRAKPPAAPNAKSAHQIRCPNCGERQTMRVLCRGCASLLEVALKAKAERDADAKARARSSGFLSIFGL